MHGTGLALPLQPVSSDKPALRNDQTRLISAQRLQNEFAQAELAFCEQSAAVRARLRKTRPPAWIRTGYASSSSRSRAAWNSRWPRVWSSSSGP